MNIKDIKLNLVTGYPIEFENSLIHQPTLDMIIKMREVNFNRLLAPFSLSLDNIGGLTDELKSQMKTFDILFANNCSLKVGEERIIDILVDGLKMFFKTDDVIVYYPKNENFIFMDEIELIPKIIIDGCTRITRFNFDELRDLMLVICQRQLPKPDNIEDDPILKKITNEIARQKYLRHINNQKMAKEEEDRKQAEKYMLANLIQDIETDRKGEIDYGTTTMYQLITKYKNMFVLEQYKHKMDLLSTGMVSTKDLNIVHWTDGILKE